ncbi:MAG: hypothetical protein ACLQQB_01985 [Solirubrobacteraceae bacterium]
MAHTNRAHAATTPTPAPAPTLTAPQQHYLALAQSGVATAERRWRVGPGRRG